jgi:hypothetical protein
VKQVPDLKDLRGEQELARHPLYHRERETVAISLRALRSAVTPADFNCLHRDLIGRFLGAQRFLESLATEKTAANAALRAARDGGDESELRRRSKELANLEADRRAAAAVLSIQRQLGDGLAWALLDYRRSAATVLGEGERVDRLADAAGLEAELALIDELSAPGVPAIHTDITSCLQHGDVLAVRSFYPRLYELTEVKAGGGSDTAQMERLERATRLLNTGFHPTAAAGGPLTVVSGPVAFRTHVEAAAAAIEEARECSYVALEFEDGLVAEVYDESNPARLSRQDFEDLQAGFLTQLGWSEGDRIAYSTSARRLRDRRQSFSSLAPLPLLPFSVEVTMELLMGGFDIVTTINAARIEERLAERGIEAEVARAEGVEHSFLTARRGRATVTVPATVREQISVELLTVEALVEMIDWTLGELAKLDRDGAQMIIDYADEAGYWTQYQP